MYFLCLGTLERPKSKAVWIVECCEIQAVLQSVPVSTHFLGPPHCFFTKSKSPTSHQVQNLTHLDTLMAKGDFQRRTEPNLGDGLTVCHLPRRSPPRLLGSVALMDTSEMHLRRAARVQRNRDIKRVCVYFLVGAAMQALRGGWLAWAFSLICDLVFDGKKRHMYNIYIDSTWILTAESKVDHGTGCRPVLFQRS